MNRIINFREYSIYRTRDGEKLKGQMLYRSGNLSRATAGDLEMLKSLGIRTIMDFRDGYEAAANPDPEIPGIEHVFLPASSDDMPMLKADTRDKQRELLRSLSKGMMIETYRLLPFRNPAYRVFFDLALNGDGAILHHCSAGKDRAGVAAALMLLALDVDEETVIRDYLISQKAFHAISRTIMKGVPWHLKLYVKHKLRPVLRADRDYIKASLDAIKSRYPSYDSFFEQEYGLDSFRREKLRKRFISCE